MSKKITDLPTLASAQVTDVLPIVDMTANVTKQVTTANVAAAVFASAPTEVEPHTRLKETLSNFIASGCVWTATSGLNAGMTAGVVYIGGYRIPVASITTQAFTASKDTYVSVDNTGAVSVANSVANGAAAPALPANSQWLALVVTGASAVTSVVMSGADSNGVSLHSTGAVKAGNIDFTTFARPTTNMITTFQTTTSGTYVDLATVGPSVDVIVPSSGTLLVYMYTYMNHGSTGAAAYMSFNLSGANTLLADDIRSLQFKAYTTNAEGRFGGMIPLTGLNPGLTTVTAKYKSSVSTAGFAIRTITADPRQ